MGGERFGRAIRGRPSTHSSLSLGYASSTEDCSLWKVDDAKEPVQISYGYTDGYETDSSLAESVSIDIDFSSSSSSLPSSSSISRSSIMVRGLLASSSELDLLDVRGREPSELVKALNLEQGPPRKRIYLPPIDVSHSAICLPKEIMALFFHPMNGGGTVKSFDGTGTQGELFLELESPEIFGYNAEDDNRAREMVRRPLMDMAPLRRQIEIMRHPNGVVNLARGFKKRVRRLFSHCVCANESNERLQPNAVLRRCHSYESFASGSMPEMLTLTCSNRREDEQNEDDYATEIDGLPVYRPTADDNHFLCVCLGCCRGFSVRYHPAPETDSSYT